jgi:hypothetical protein
VIVQLKTEKFNFGAVQIDKKLNELAVEQMNLANLITSNKMLDQI